MWFTFALIGYFLLAVVFVLDKIILTKTTVMKPAVYTFYSTVFLFGVLLIWPFGVEFLHGIDWLWAIGSGVAFGFGLWTLFAALKRGEASHIDPLNGAVITVATFLAAAGALGEHLSPVQIFAMIILVLAALLLALEKSGARDNQLSGFGLALVSGVLFALSHVSAKYIYGLYPFVTGFVWTRASIGVVALVTLCVPSVRESLKHKNIKTVKQKNIKQPVGLAKRYAVFLVATDKALAIAAVVFIQYAMALGSVTLVAAMSGLQYVLMFVLIYFFTRCAPKIFHERFTRRELLVQMMAIVLVALGSAALVL